MRKRYAFLIAILLLAFVAGLAWRLSQPREPMYEGRPLSYWLEGYNPDTLTETSRQSADNALRGIGTNAIPTLLRMLQEYDSPLKVKFLNLVEKQRLIKIPHVRAGRRNYNAMKGFEFLGPTAKGAVPQLLEIYEHSKSITSHNNAAMSLAAIGPSANDAIPTLIKGLESTNDSARYFSSYALGEIHSEPGLVVPVLSRTLSDATKLVARGAADALGRFGSDAKPAVPALINSLNDPDPYLHTAIVSALKQIDPQAAASLSTNLPSAQTSP